MRGVSSTAAVVAALGSAPSAKSAAEASWVPQPDPEGSALAAQVLAERRPVWLEDLAVRLVGGESASAFEFPVVRTLVREGVIAEPTGASYALAMVRGLVPWTARRDSTATPLGALREDPALLERELWLLLGAERAGRTLGYYDAPDPLPERGLVHPRPDATWRHALVVLAEEGAVPRDRLLEATLHAMLADWAAADVGWFIDLHDALRPTDEELAVREQTYLRLLANEIGTVVQVGLRAAGRLLDHGTVEHGALAAALEPVLLRPQKGTAMAALKLLERVAGEESADLHLLAETARAALDHPRADVRERARELTGRWAPSGSADPGTSSATGLSPAVASFVVADPEPVTPAADADEVAELLAHLIEEADDPVAVERALDGVLRFAKAKPASAGALADRAATRLTELYPGPWSGQELRADLAALCLVWLGRAHPGEGYLGRTVGHDFTRGASAVRKPDWSLAALVTMRVHEVATQIRGGARLLLSLPTSSDGALAARVLNDRLPVLRAAPPLDLDLALLRVPPDQRAEVRVPRLLRGRAAAVESLEMLANHTPHWKRVVGPTTDQWGRESITMVAWADPASPAGAPDRPAAAVLDRRAPLERAGQEANDGEDVMRPEQVTATWPLLLPHHPDHLAAHAHPRLARALARNRSGAAPLVEAIGRSPRPGGTPTWSALTLGLAAKDSVVRTAAIDAFIIRAGRGLVDVVGLGEQIVGCLADELVVGSRIVESLAEAARADPTSAKAVLETLVATLEALPGRRDANRWIELVADLSVRLDRPVALPRAFSDLALGTDKSVLAQACRRVISERLGST